MTFEKYVEVWDPDGMRASIPGFIEKVREIWDLMDEMDGTPNPYGSALNAIERRGEFPEFDEQILTVGTLGMELAELIRRNETMT